MRTDIKDFLKDEILMKDEDPGDLYGNIIAIFDIPEFDIKQKQTFDIRGCGSLEMNTQWNINHNINLGNHTYGYNIETTLWYQSDAIEYENIQILIPAEILIRNFRYTMNFDSYESMYEYIKIKNRDKVIDEL
jgi:hypothetical protein